MFFGGGPAEWRAAAAQALFTIQGRLRVEALGEVFRVWGLGLIGFRVYGFRFRVWGLGLRDVKGLSGRRGFTFLDINVSGYWSISARDLSLGPQGLTVLGFGVREGLGLAV